MRRKPVILNLFVKIVPEHLSAMVMRHRLFQREIHFYRLVINLLARNTEHAQLQTL